MPAKGTSEDWLAWLTSGDQRLRKKATLILGGLTPKSQVQLQPLISALESPVDDVVFWSVCAFRCLRSRARPALPKLLDLTNHPFLGIRQSAIPAVVAVAPRDPRVKSAVLRCLSDPHPSVRYQALQALISVPDLSPEDLSQIASMAKDSDRHVARWSEIALNNIALKAARRKAPRARAAGGA